MPYDRLMNYSEAKMFRDQIEAEISKHSAILNSFPKGPMGLTPDSVKALPEWQSSKKAVDLHIARLQSFNQMFTKAFKSEIRAERNQRFGRTA